MASHRYSLAALCRFLCRGMRGGYALLLAGLLLASPALFSPAGAEGRALPLTPEEKGRQIYTSGTSPSGKEITAVMAGADVPASALPCASCHGADGTGRPEGGVRPANLTWDILTTALRGGSPGGRARPAYDERKLRRAITMGFDPAGARLQAAMPRYRMSAEDIASLIAYLKVLGSERHAGLTDSTIDVMMVSSLDGARRDAAVEAEGIVAAYFDQINERGGIYNRALKLRRAPAHGVGADAPFAILGGVTDHRGDSLLAFMSSGGVPAIAIRAIDREDEGAGASPSDHLLSLYPTIAHEAASLALNAREHLSTRPGSGVIIHADDARSRRAAARIVDRCHAGGWSDLRAIELAANADPASLVRSLREKGVDMVMPVGASPAMSALLGEIALQQWRPAILICGESWDLDHPAIPQQLEERVYLSYPSWLETISPSGMAEYTTLRRRNHLVGRYMRAQISALAGAMIFVEGLKRAGRELTREKLTGGLERLLDFETGLIPPVTFTPSGRIGSDDLYIVALGSGAGTPSLIGHYAMPRSNE